MIWMTRSGATSFEAREEAKRCVFGYIEGFYNTTRMHLSLNWQSPRAFRRAFEAKQMDAAVAATSEIENESTFNRKPSPKGEPTKHLTLDERREVPKQAPRISQ